MWTSVPASTPMGDPRSSSTVVGTGLSATLSDDPVSNFHLRQQGWRFKVGRNRIAWEEACEALGVFESIRVKDDSLQPA